MSKRPVFLAAAGVLALGVFCASFAQPSMPSVHVDAADSTFMTRATADGMAEMQMGQLALSKSSDDQVKQLAKRIVDDHTQANQTLQALAQAKQVTLPSAPSKDALKSVDSMKKMQGRKFDKAWTAAMVKDHQQAVALFTTEKARTSDADLRKFSSGTLPVLTNHLDTAHKLQDHLAVADARDKAMSGTGVMEDSSFAHTNPATPATRASPVMPATPAAATLPAHAGSKGSH